MGNFLLDFKKMRLLMNSVRDGCTPGVFHKLCDKKGATLVVIKSGEFVAGGFTDIGWNHSCGYLATYKSFLFSVNSRRLYPLKVNTREKGIHSSENLGPVFGGGHDICIEGEKMDMAIIQI